MPREELVSRRLWDFRKANWDLLQRRCAEANWDFLEEANPDEAAEELTQRLLDWMAMCIPMRAAKFKKSTHPWLIEEVLQKVRRKVDLSP